MVTGNSFLGGTGGFYFGPSWAAYAHPDTTGTLDVTCNFWGDATGPTNATLNPSGTGRNLTVSTYPGDSVPTFSPWNSTDDGACDGV